MKRQVITHDGTLLAPPSSHQLLFFLECRKSSAQRKGGVQTVPPYRSSKKVRLAFLSGVGAFLGHVETLLDDVVSVKKAAGRAWSSNGRQEGGLTTY